jgi:predicted flap endonuclease-1-like 5' DNA nuclease
MFQQNIALGPGTEAFSSHLLEIIIMLLGAAILGFIIGWLFRKTYKEVYLSMKEEHDKCPGIKASLEQSISGLKSDLGISQADLEKARELISNLNRDIAGLKADLNTKISSLDTANLNIAQLEKEIHALKERGASLQASLDKSNLSISALDGEKANLNNEIKRLKEEINKIGLKVAAATPVIKAPDMKKAALILGKNWHFDDLKIVEGIGPKIEELFHKAGINTWHQLAASEVSKLKEILVAGGEQFQMHDPSTWPQQAKLAENGLWKEFKELTDKLQGGRV